MIRQLEQVGNKIIRTARLAQQQEQLAVGQALVEPQTRGLVAVIRGHGGMGGVQSGQVGHGVSFQRRQAGLPNMWIGQKR